MGVISTAKSFIGKIKYVFGSTNIEGGTGDCSAFTQYVFKQNGIDIGRTTSLQYQEGVSVDRENLQGGDLVFFKDTYDSNYVDGVSHVGISLGGSKFIHLSSSGVAISDLNENYWNAHYLDSKRIYGASDTDTEPETETNDKVINTGFFSGNGVKWFGDIVTVVLCLLLIVGGVALLAVGVKQTAFGG